MSSPWVLWATDSFDREAAPSREDSGDALVEGLALLWKKTLAEGLDDRGNATFTWFSLSLARGSIALVHRPFDNVALARLRSWRLEPGLIETLAKAHAANATPEGLAILFDAALAADSAATFIRQLATLSV